MKQYCQNKEREMGSDIKVMVEEYLYTNSEYKWCTISNFKIDYYEDNDTGKPIYRPVNIYPNRNYDCFYALCGVRGDSCEDLIPISKPRGFPDDMCKYNTYFKNLISYCNEYNYPYSHVSLYELYQHVKMYPFYTQKGYVSCDIAKEYELNKVIPNEFCGYTNAKDYRFLKWKKPNPLTDLIKAVEKLVSENSYICLQKLREENSPKIRILFMID
jgi:hypothetical protein